MKLSAISQIDPRAVPVDRKALCDRLAVLETAQLALVQIFTEQLLEWQDPDVVAAFLAWRSDPKIASILELAAALEEEEREQLLFMAEDLYSATPKC
jgi:hypothetical protein